MSDTFPLKGSLSALSTNLTACQKKVSILIIFGYNYNNLFLRRLIFLSIERYWKTDYSSTESNGLIHLSRHTICNKMLLNVLKIKIFLVIYTELVSFSILSTKWIIMENRKVRFVIECYFYYLNCFNNKSTLVVLYFYFFCNKCDRSNKINFYLNSRLFFLSSLEKVEQQLHVNVFIKYRVS